MFVVNEKSIYNSFHCYKYVCVCVPGSLLWTSTVSLQISMVATDDKLNNETDMNWLKALICLQTHTHIR